jgi:hypothetical protein
MEVQFFLWNGGSNGAGQTIDVTEGTIYEFRGVYFSPSEDNPMSRAHAFAYWYDDLGELISWGVITEDTPLVHDAWTPIAGTVTAPPKAQTAWVRVLIQNLSSTTETNPGIAYFDDLWFAPVGTAPTVQELFVPAAASTPGGGGTFWTTSGWFSNLTSSRVVIHGAALLQGQDNRAAVANPIEIGTVEAGGFLRLGDVFHQLDADGQTGGLFLELTAEGQPPFTRLVSMATYTSTPNSTGGGAYGQGIPATLPGTEAEVVCPGIKDHGSHRTNVGVLNTSDRSIEVEVAIVNEMGTLVGSATWNLQPFEQRQQRVTALGAAGLGGGTAIFRLVSLEGSFLGYASVVDNETGDAVFIAGN